MSGATPPTGWAPTGWAPSAREPVLCAVDGGGTGTRVRLHDARGTPLASARAGPSSLTLGVEQAWRNVRAAIAEAAAEAGLPGLCGPRLRVAAALAGSRSAERRAAFLAADPLGCEIVLISDGYAALLGALDGAPGSVVAVGTGIAARRLHACGRVRAITGWGFPAGDEGSGAWIGHRAVAAYLRHADGRPTEPSALLPALAARIGAARGEILAWLIEADATRYAALAPLVAAAAAGGDAPAAAILDAAAAEVAVAIEALDAGDPSPAVALVGGLAPVLEGRLPGAIRARLVPARGTALDGALKVLLGTAPAEAAA